MADDHMNKALCCEYTVCVYIYIYIYIYIYVFNQTQYRTEINWSGIKKQERQKNIQTRTKRIKREKMGKNANKKKGFSKGTMIKLDDPRTVILFRHLEQQVGKNIDNRWPINERNGKDEIVRLTLALLGSIQFEGRKERNVA